MEKKKDKNVGLLLNLTLKRLKVHLDKFSANGWKGRILLFWLLLQAPLFKVIFIQRIGKQSNYFLQLKVTLLTHGVTYHPIDLYSLILWCASCFTCYCFIDSILSLLIGFVVCKVPLHILTSICFTPSPFFCKGELDLYNSGLFYALLVFLCFLPATIAIVSSILLLHMSFSLFLLLVYCFWKVHMIMIPFRNKLLWMTYLHFSVYTRVLI